MTGELGHAIRFGPLGGAGVAVTRSGLHWLCEEGHLCRPNEVIAYCNISLDGAPLRAGGAAFAEERALQVAIAPRVGGRLRRPADALGGHLGMLSVRPWDAEAAAAYIQPEPGGAAAPAAGADLARLMVLAGRRMVWAVDVDVGLLPGWHARARAWWGEAPAPGPTLLSAGICDASGAVRGDRSGFLEMFEAAGFPAQIVHISEHPIAPCATTLLEGFLRAPAQLEAILADTRRALGEGAPTPEDWMFFGALAAQLGHSPMRETYDLLTPRGLERGGTADAILLSVIAEPFTILRHRRLGYHLNVLPHDQRAAGPLARAWLRRAFEPVARSLETMRADYVRLIETVGRATGARFMILNRMSTSGREDVSSYAPFDAPMGRTLTSIAAKELNLLLEDLAERHGVFVVDVDAIAAEIGGAAHLPDGVHQSGLAQARVREEILAELASGASR